MTAGFVAWGSSLPARAADLSSQYSKCCKHAARSPPTMVNLRKGYREEQKVGNNGFKRLQGKFVPQTANYASEMKQLDDIENGPAPDEYDPFDGELGVLATKEVRVGSGHDEGEVPPGAASSALKWSRRAEAAKKRWANPDYRAKMLETRRRKQMEKKKKEAPSKRLELDAMDSIAHSSEERAAQITAYAQSIAKRRAKMLKYHHHAAEWMEERLEQGRPQRDAAVNDEWKKLRQKQRGEIARKRHVTRKSKT